VNSQPKFGNVFFVNNRAGISGGAFYGTGNAEFHNSLWYNNRVGTTQSAINSVGSTIIYNSIINGSVSGATITYSFISESYAGEGNMSGEHGFYEPTENDFRLLENSQCLNAGNISVVPTWLTTDFFGAPRVSSGRINMGPFEGVVIIPVTTSPLNNSFLTPETTSTGVNWGWQDAVPNDINTYQVEYWINNEHYFIIANIAFEETSAIINNLSPTMNVRWRVNGINIYGLRNKSEWSTFTIMRDKPVYIKPDGTGDGTSWNKATNIGSAFANYIYGDNLWLANGVYYPTATNDRTISINIPDGMKLYGGFVGNENFFEHRNPEKNKAIFSGDINSAGVSIDNTLNIITLKGTSANPITNNTIIDGIVLEQGYANVTGTEHNTNRGGAIYMTHASPLIVNVWFRNNYSSLSGGAVYGDSNSTPYFYNCIFSKNRTGYEGGAVDANAAMRFVNCVFYSNTCLQRGGAVHGVASMRVVDVVNSILWDNKAYFDNHVFNANVYNCLVEGEYPGLSMVEGNPMFLDAENGDFRLNLLSAALDKGRNEDIPSWLSKDYASESRIKNNVVDLGVYEGGTSTPIPNLPEDNMVLDSEVSNITLQWEWSTSIPSGFEHYRLQYSKNNGAIIDINELDEMMYDVTGLNSADFIRWRVSYASFNTELELEYHWSPWFKFTIKRDSPLFVKPGASGTGSSWNNAANLQTALNIAVFGDQIWVAQGLYKPTTDLNRNTSFRISEGVKLYGGFNGEETTLEERSRITKSILCGNIGNELDNTDNTYKVVRFIGDALNQISNATVIDGFIIQNGYANHFNDYNSDGAGISFIYASPIISNCEIKNCYAVNDGGAIFANAFSRPIFANTIFTDNYANRNGGAIATEGVMTFYNCLWYKNYAVSFGGAITAPSNNQTTVYNSIFNSNKAGNNHNDFRNIRVYKSIVESGAGFVSITDDPLFSDASNYNFALLEESPGINAGNTDIIPQWLSFDYNGAVRVQGNLIDIGPFESNFDVENSINQPSINKEIKLTIWPNPISTGNSLKVRIDKGKEVTINIIDNSGRLRVQQSLISDIENTINVSNLEPGFYIVRVYDNKSGQTGFNKLIIK
jgi:predicted outer membrane repeat protein